MYGITINNCLHYCDLLREKETSTSLLLKVVKYYKIIGQTDPFFGVDVTKKKKNIGWTSEYYSYHLDTQILLEKYNIQHKKV